MIRLKTKYFILYICVFMIFIFNKENNKTNKKIMENDTDVQREIEWDTFSSTDSNTSTQEKTNQEEKKQTNCDIFFIHVLFFNTK
jgi:hypothetical protein